MKSLRKHNLSVEKKNLEGKKLVALYQLIGSRIKDNSCIEALISERRSVVSDNDKIEVPADQFAKVYSSSSGSYLLSSSVP